MTWDRHVTIKSDAEIAIMREAGRINAMALDAVRKLIAPGVSTADLNAAAEEVQKAHGVYSPFKNYPGPYPYPASICTSINSELVHGIPSFDCKLKEGDIISIDCGTVFEGFVGDSAFTAGVGEVSKEAKKILEVTEKALYIGISKMKDGNRAGDVGAAIQRFVESQGFNVVREYTGHGVGRNMHEGPQLPNYGTEGQGVLLQKGMTIALEPMILAGKPQTKVLPDEWTVCSRDGRLTAHFEHTVAITGSEPIILTEL